jgi:hypothetical protein
MDQEANTQQGVNEEVKNSLYTAVTLCSIHL